MKKHIIKLATTVLLFISISFSRTANAQGQEMQQLLLNIEKLTQLKSILADMKTGYQIYEQGYGTVSSLAKGNFSLHSVYLNGLLEVSPVVRNYGRVAEIISQQASLLHEYKSAFAKFKRSGSFNAKELDYMSSVYSHLVKQSLNDLSDLANVLTATKLRMSDDERIKAIDRIYTGSNDKLQFIRHFNCQGTLLSLQRTKEMGQVKMLKQLYGINN
ncbi:hypothetical protein [Mucilaginibacter pedocola]|uniref:TerB family tellurite resistance protein n=1 Tax=Mucilaginibacter pedocola TaxID=1792845 RepID=A0A1S9PLV1_9SPHI|nr:hypothetical protein [Mucilaginibacter pedocola]OOQ61946.1 hypothetical protein BC343_02475 [Mucilaginibacter pedocola]